MGSKGLTTSDLEAQQLGHLLAFYATHKSLNLAFIRLILMHLPGRPLSVCLFSMLPVGYIKRATKLNAACVAAELLLLLFV